MGRRAAFTLLELMVTVSIIVVLLALLVPSFVGARDKAKMVRCGTNLKGIGSALFTYAGSNNGTAIHGSYFTPPPNMSYWPEELVADGDVKVRTRQVDETGVIGNAWVTGRGIFYCPSHWMPEDQLNGNDPGDGSPLTAGYGIGYYAGSILWGGGGVYPIGAPLPANRFFIKRVQDWNQCHIVASDGVVDMAHHGSWTGANQGDVKTRHFQGANYLMGDGHVEWSKTYQLLLIDQPDGIWSHYGGPRGWGG